MNSFEPCSFARWEEGVCFWGALRGRAGNDNKRRRVAVVFSIPSIQLSGKNRIAGILLRRVLRRRGRLLRDDGDDDDGHLLWPLCLLIWQTLEAESSEPSRPMASDTGHCNPPCALVDFSIAQPLYLLSSPTDIRARYISLGPFL